ncbi:MAG: Cof-type HAD-IIB family hydrolase [Nibricoccus sp.]
MHPVSSRQNRLAAIDLDGTLLGPKSSLSADNLAAVERLRRNGAEIVLASGRHHASMQEIAKAVPGVRWLVSSQGGEVSDLERRQCLHTVFLQPSLAHQATMLGLRLGFSAIVYTANDVRSSADNEGVRIYARLAGNMPTVCAPEALLAGSIFKIIWVGNNPAQFDALASNTEVNAFPATKVRTHQYFFEIMPPDVSKGSALAVLAKHMGIDARDAVVFGDGENDIPMFEWAGTSFAMPHGWPAARERATFVAPEGAPETALARAIEQLLTKLS